MTNIKDFYAQRTIFITGATGFMGKVLLEKLLRSCPAISKIYLLVRPKRGHTSVERVEELLDCKLFDKIRSENPEFKKKIIAISGDILQPGVGISDENKKLLFSDVSVVFHSAATVKFDEALKLSIQMNVIGVGSMIELAHQMSKLEAFVHVSTAYANCDRHSVKEYMYPPPIHPQKVLDAIEWMDDEAIEMLTPRLVKPRPNTYTFTKALAECYLAEKRGNVPVTIVRPSIVGASWQEPFAGWVDNFNGPTGLLAAIGKGVLRSMLGDSKNTADIIPVDIATNLMIASAWHTAMERPAHIDVYNCTSGNTNPVTWGDIEKLSYTCFMKTPVDNMIRIPSPHFTSSSVWHSLNVWFDHHLPAWFLDVMMRISGRKPIFMRIQQKLWKSVSSLDYFTSNQWEFDNTNVLSLFERLTAEDQKEFNFDVSKIQWSTYFENYCFGTKIYALKEDPKDLPKARKHVQRLQQKNRVINVICIILLSRFLFARFTMVKKLWYFFIRVAVGIFKKLPGFAKAS